MTPLMVEVPGGTLRGRVTGPTDGPRLLMLHGGPGMSDAYLDGLIAEFTDRYRVATYAQRGVLPSTAAGPFDLATQAQDALAVIAALGWERPVVLGHSWGGHLLLHVVAAHPGEVMAAVALEPIGAVGDGGVEVFSETIEARLPEDRRAALADPGLAQEDHFRIVWPAYFPPGAPVPPCPTVEIAPEANARGGEALDAALPPLAEALHATQVPVLFVAGDGSPIPVSASTDTASLIGAAATVIVLTGVGHFPWLQQPGLVRAEVDGFLAGLPPQR